MSSSNLNFSVLTLSMSLIFWQLVVQPRPKYSYCILELEEFWSEFSECVGSFGRNKYVVVLGD